MKYIAIFFGIIINFVYQIVKNYGLTIIVFTLFTKIVLFPISILVQKNSIKMVKMKPKIDELKLRHNNDKEAFMEAQIDLFEKEKYHPSFGAIPLIIQIPIILVLVGIMRNPSLYIQNIKSTIFGIMDLSVKPSTNDYYIIPIVAAISTIFLWLVENRINVLQRETSLLNKLATGLITIAVTVYFVFIVPNGVGLYWICGDIFAVLQLLILNAIYPPKKYVDYDYLNRIKQQRIEQHKFNKISKKKSKYYYKKFFETDNIDNMKLVIYAEGKGYYKYFKGIVEYILNNSNIVVHYITSDLNDTILDDNNPKVKAYYIATNQLIPLFMKLECDIVLTTTPDLQNFYLKRSIVRKDIEYIYTMHGVGSPNLCLKTGALDYFDTIFAVGPSIVRDVREIEELRKSKIKNVLECGYPLLDNMIKEYIPKINDKKTILIAPSWQKNNIIDSCIEEILDNLLKTDYKVVLRPHPQYLKFGEEKISWLAKKYNEKDNENFIIQTNFSPNDTVYNADLLITDWSSIAFEYSFTTLKPTLFIDTPMKIMNPDYKKIKNEPIDIYLRDKIGERVKVNNINDEMINKIQKVLNNKEMSKQIEKFREENIFNIGNSSSIAGKYIIEQIRNVKNNGK